MDLDEDFYPYGDGGEARAALRRKEEELVLAAQLGNALLSENLQLKEEKNKLQEQYTEKIEVRWVALSFHFGSELSGGR